MEKENKYYGIIENLVRKHKKFPGLEPILEDIIDNVFSHSEVILKTINNQDVINAYLEKVVSTSIITVPKKKNFHPETRQRTLIREPDEIRVDKRLIKEMINAPETVTPPPEPVREEIKNEDAELEEIAAEPEEIAELQEEPLVQQEETFIQQEQTFMQQEEVLVQQEEVLGQQEEAFIQQEEAFVEEEQPQVIPEAVVNERAQIDTIELNMQPDPVEIEEVAPLNFVQTGEETIEEVEAAPSPFDIRNNDDDIDLGSFAETISDDELSIKFDDNDTVDEFKQEPVSFNVEGIAEAPIDAETAQPESSEINEGDFEPEGMILPETIDLTEGSSEEELDEELEVEQLEIEEPGADVTETVTEYTDIEEQADTEEDLSSFDFSDETEESGEGSQTELESPENYELTESSEIQEEVTEPLIADEKPEELVNTETPVELELSDAPQEELELSQAPQEELVTTDVPQEDLAVSEAPQDELLASDAPQEELAVSEAPQDELLASDSQQEELNLQENAVEELNPIMSDSDDLISNVDLNADFSLNPVEGELEEFMPEASGELDLLQSDAVSTLEEVAPEPLLEQEELSESSEVEPLIEHKEPDEPSESAEVSNADSQTFATTDYSKFDFTPEDNELDSSVDIELVAKDLQELAKKNPDLNILEIYNMKYKENAQVSQIAAKLDLSENKVIDALNEIIAVI